MSEGYINKTMPSEMKKLAIAIIGTLIYAIGMNIFIIPVGLYSGGLMGISQVIRTILVDYLHISVGNNDIAGIIYYILNIPAFILAYRKIGKGFFMKTVICVSATTFFLSIIRIPSSPILTDDILASCLIGGLIAGCGIGLTLKMGSSLGGTDIVGLYFIKKNPNFSVGKASLITNVVLYSICLFLFDEKIVIYSVIFAAVNAITVDKVHSQNINVQVTIITKSNIEKMEKDIIEKLERGITKWNATGAYTSQETSVLFVVLSKYEVSYLKKIVHKYDEHAFIVVNEGANIEGHFLKKLNA